jgi:hypothetical protein
MNFKFEPVAWLTTLSVILAALLQVDSEYHLLPEGWVRWLAFAAGVLALVLVGIKTRNRVTPLAAPVDDAGNRLVPTSRR